MKHYLLAVVGLAIGFAGPVVAQEKDAVDPNIAEQLSALSRKTDEAYNNGDAAALAKLYTEDALLLTNTGPIYGREAIEKHFTELFQKVHFSKHLDILDHNSPHIMGRQATRHGAMGNGLLLLKPRAAIL